MRPRQISTHGWCVRDDMRAEGIAMERKVAEEEDDVMAHTWCCLTCSAMFRFGQIRMKLGLHCPKCDSEDLHPADGGTIEVSEYAGPVGTLN